MGHFGAFWRVCRARVISFIVRLFRGRQNKNSGKLTMSKVRLYISGSEVDFGDGESLLLFTYTAGELDAPAVVQNSYSKEITLPPTQRNARLFGALWRVDKMVGSTDTFDALTREPFEIRNNAGELLESGYVKLSSASASDGFKVVLYGGLGAFLYGLMFNSDGSKKSLADLTWGDTLDAGLSFNITKAIVAAAWDRLENTTDPMPLASPYDIINFAPMQNGIPSDFDANKGLVPVGGAHGCPAVTGENGITIDGTSYALVTFGKDFNEWEVRDLRSYLQRPVFRIKALLSALENPNNNGGYEFDWSAVQNLLDLRAWMTLPLLHTEEITEGNTPLTISWGTNPITSNQMKNSVSVVINTAETLPAVGKLTISVVLKLRISHASTAYATSLWNGNFGLCIFARLIGYDSGNNPIVYGPMRELAYADNRQTRAAGRFLGGYTGTTEEGYWENSIFGPFRKEEVELQVQSGNLTKPSAGISVTDSMGLSLSGYNIDHFKVVIGAVTGEQEVGHIDWSVGTLGVPFGTATMGAATISQATLLAEYGNALTENSTRVRTGAYISKKALLGGTTSPADLLLSLVKTFGFVLAYDGLNKRIRLLNRGDFYAGQEVNLQERIDRSRPYIVEPNGISEKWLEFALHPALGAFAQYYRQRYGIEYGAKRVNTGSPFNVDTLKVLDGVQFVEAVTGLAYSRYFYLVEDASVGSGILPSPYLDNDCKYTLWKNPSGEASEHDIKALTNAVTLTTINDTGISNPNGYDTDWRVLLANADGGSDGDGAGMLLFKDAMLHEYTHLTDDAAGMLNKNNGNPCWIPCLTDTADLVVPSFISANFTHNWGDVERSLNIAAPQELAGRDYYFREGRAVYDRRWREYIADRYDENAHRVTCYVDWSGIPVGQALLGKFFWFDGSWWVLDKIEDYCWDNPQPCKCTFVRVLNKSAYTNGQS